MCDAVKHSLDQFCLSAQSTAHTHTLFSTIINSNSSSIQHPASRIYIEKEEQNSTLRQISVCMCCAWIAPQHGYNAQRNKFLVSLYILIYNVLWMECVIRVCVCVYAIVESENILHKKNPNMCIFIYAYMMTIWLLLLIRYHSGRPASIQYKKGSSRWWRSHCALSSHSWWNRRTRQAQNSQSRFMILDH